MCTCMCMYVANSKQILNEINDTWLGFHNNNFIMKTSGIFFCLSQQFFLRSPLASYHPI